MAGLQRQLFEAELPRELARMASSSGNSCHEASGIPVTTTGCGRSLPPAPRQLSDGDESAQLSRPALKGMKMQQLRQVCQAHKIQYSTLARSGRECSRVGLSSSGVNQITQPTGPRRNDRLPRCPTMWGMPTADFLLFSRITNVRLQLAGAKFVPVSCHFWSWSFQCQGGLPAL